MKLIYAAAAFGVAFVQIAKADTLFTVPDTCTGVATIQSIDCTVSHLYRCPSPVGELMNRVDIGPEGPFFVTRTDSEGRWIQSVSYWTDEVDLLGEERDPASITELLSNGVDSFDFDTITNGAEVQMNRGYDALAGEPVYIDDEHLLPTRSKIYVFDEAGTQVSFAKSDEYLHPDWRVFIGGRSSFASPEGTFEHNGTPISFARPGEQGYLSMTPLHGCDATTISAPLGIHPEPAARLSGDLP